MLDTTQKFLYFPNIVTNNDVMFVGADQSISQPYEFEAMLGRSRIPVIATFLNSAGREAVNLHFSSSPAQRCPSFLKFCKTVWMNFVAAERAAPIWSQNHSTGQGLGTITLLQGPLYGFA
jgi:hypothetical protein